MENALLRRQPLALPGTAAIWLGPQNPGYWVIGRQGWYSALPRLGITARKLDMFRKLPVGDFKSVDLEG